MTGPLFSSWCCQDSGILTNTSDRLHLPLHAVAVGGVVPHELEVLLVDALVGDGAGAAPALTRHRVLVVIVADVSEGSAGHLLGGARVTFHDT